MRRITGRPVIQREIDSSIANELRGACWDVELVIPTMKPCGFHSYLEPSSPEQFETHPAQLWRSRARDHALENGIARDLIPTLERVALGRDVQTSVKRH